MNSSDEKLRAAIAEQAADWYVADEEGPLDVRDSAALAAWLRTSPVHVEEFLGVSVVARDLKEARSDPEYSLETILARARVEDGAAVRPLWPRVIELVRARPLRLWPPAAMAACALLSLGLLWQWSVRQPLEHPLVSGRVTALNFQTRHGELLTRRLIDNSVLHLDTDSAVTIQYSNTERLVMLTAGQADFEVAHESNRPFRVFAGSAEVVDLGTKFDVRLDHDSTVVTVIEGRVAVGPSPELGKLNTNASQNHPSRFVQLSADQQIRVSQGEWPATPASVDPQRTTAWLRREIVFDHEPLEHVVSEYNRYTAKPIEIATPALRNLQITGVFSTDDTEAFLAFLRSLKGVRVEVTETRIRVT